MTMPKFGHLLNPYEDTLKQIEFFGKSKFDFVEFSVEEPMITPELISKNKQKIRKAMEKHNLFATVHGPINSEMGSNYPDIRANWLRFNKKFIRSFSNLHVKKFLFHTRFQMLGEGNKNLEKIFLDNYASSFNQIASFSKKYGIKIVVENGNRIGFKDAENIKHILDRVKDLGFCFDFGHAFVRGGMKSIETFFKLLGNRIEHVHMHDNHGISDEHLSIGKGKINYPYVVKMLKKFGYDKTITLEIFTSKEDAINSREKIKAMWQK
jgi:sugar phosphate isomerase/epimerase